MCTTRAHVNRSWPLMRYMIGSSTVSWISWRPIWMHALKCSQWVQRQMTMGGWNQRHVYLPRCSCLAVCHHLTRMCQYLLRLFLEVTTNPAVTPSHGQPGCMQPLQPWRRHPRGKKIGKMVHVPHFSYKRGRKNGCQLSHKSLFPASVHRPRKTHANGKRKHSKVAITPVTQVCQVCWITYMKRCILFPSNRILSRMAKNHWPQKNYPLGQQTCHGGWINRIGCAMKRLSSSLRF